MPPSLHAYNENKCVVICPNLMVIHKPKVDKWDYSIGKNEKYIIIECAIPYAIKIMMYPRLIRPICYCAFLYRIKKHLRNIEKGRERCDELVKDTLKNYPITEHISWHTFIKLLKRFGLSIF